jgi:hypothetical protein
MREQVATADGTSTSSLVFYIAGEAKHWDGIRQRGRPQGRRRNSSLPYMMILVPIFILIVMTALIIAAGLEPGAG